MSDRRTEWAPRVERWGTIVLLLLAAVALVAVISLIDSRYQSWGGLSGFANLPLKVLASNEFANGIQLAVFVALAIGVWLVVMENRESSANRGQKRLVRSLRNTKDARHDVETRAINRWRRSFRPEFKARQESYLARGSWIISKREDLIAVDPTDSAGGFPIEWVSAGLDTKSYAEPPGSPIATAVSKITAGRHANWSELVAELQPDTFDGPTIVVASVIDAESGDFASAGFLKVRPSSYFHYLNSSSVLGVLDDYAQNDFQLSRLTKINPRSHRKRILKDLRRIDPLKFEQRSASVGLNVALLIEQDVGRTSPTNTKTWRLLLQARSNDVAMTPGQVHVVPSGELSTSISESMQRSKDPMRVRQFVYTSFIESLVQDLYPADPSQLGRQIQGGSIANKERGVGLSSCDLLREAKSANLKLELVGFMLDSVTLKGELLGLSVVSSYDLEVFEKALNRSMENRTKKGELLSEFDACHVGILVREGKGSDAGIPQWIFETPLTPAASVLLHRVDGWLREGCMSASGVSGPFTEPPG